MDLRNISQETADRYALKENEKAVFFLLNRSGNISFDLSARGAEAHIIAFFIGKGDGKETLRITQEHAAGDTASHASVKAALFGQSEFTYEGMIHIGKEGKGSKASQEGRALLAAPDAKAFFRPSLEILPEDVECRHAATVSPLSGSALYFLQSRGLDTEQAKKLLISGFFKKDLEYLEDLGIEASELRTFLDTELDLAL